ncbi:MAG: SigB/SigF/SigG family RNA polymerase sigma factor [Solirubrobacteraceae bacterium]
MAMATTVHESDASTLMETDANELTRRWQRDGDQRARERLVEMFAPLARSLARRYARSSVPQEDLMQIAYLGLVKAIDRFDPERGGTLQAFAVPTVLGELRRYFRDSGWGAHVPRGAKETALKVREARDRLTNETGQAPTANQLAEFMEIDLEEVIEGLLALRAYETAPLEATTDPDGESGAIGSVLGGEDDGYKQVEDRVMLESALSTLTDRERAILKMRFQEELTQSQIADRVGCSQMQVSRVLSAALVDLRNTIGTAAVSPA